MSDEGLAAQTHIYASRVGAGYDDGSREYHLAAVIERCKRDLDKVRDGISAMAGVA